MKEVWRKMADYPCYEVSNMGHVKSTAKNSSSHSISLCHDRNGYLTFGPSQDGKRRTAYVHVEVARAFIDNPDNLEDVHHIDYNKENCCVDNLMWLSHEDNVKDYNCTISNPKYLKDGKGNYIQIKKDYGICIDCGAIILADSTRCANCASKQIVPNYKNGAPLSKEDIIKSLKASNGNFTKASKDFNMTDNALRKWCRKYKLSTHIKDWKNINY